MYLLLMKDLKGFLEEELIKSESYTMGGLR
jgi:hypothetical protein